jgi:DNA-binding NtrC family response regulator
MRRKWKILVLDDDAASLKLFWEVLVKSGYEVLPYADPYTALKVLKQEKSDVVICDHVMPKMDGIRFMTLAREISPKLPVILISGFGSVDKTASAMEGGAFDYLRKPCKIETIQEAVLKAVDSLEPQ